MIRRIFSVLLLFCVLGVLIQPAAVSAADYAFQVPTLQCTFFINKDGTVTIDYYIDFINRPGAHVIDYVDIGLPQTGDYDISSVVADVNGKRITDIQKSDLVKPGVALGLGANAIPASGQGRVHARIGVVRKVIFHSDLTKEKEDYASISVSPTWFDPQSTQGTTNYTFNIFFPADLEASEPRYHIPEGWPGQKEPLTGIDQASGLKYYTWQAKNANAYTKYIFGASFPARLVPAAIIQTKPWIVLPSFEELIGWGFVLFFVFSFGASIYGAIWGSRKRKLQYLPPKVSVEGMGIKRGLTAVEAAILMEQPLDRVMSMILFGLIKKNAAAVVTREPLQLNVANPLPAGLNGYELTFLDAFRETKLAARRKLLQGMVVALVKTVTEKMKGFSRKESVAYYESIIKQAWQQVEAAATPEVKSQAFDENLDWTLMDKRFDDRTREVFHSGPVYLPTWWGRYDPVYTSRAPSLGGGGQPIQIDRPNLPGADFAASMVNSVQNFAAGTVGDLTNFTGDITDTTNPIPVSTSSGSSRLGGGSCACACACAGCACACAGGGR